MIIKYAKQHTKKKKSNQRLQILIRTSFEWCIFIGFSVNLIWLPNHVTNDIMCEPFLRHGQAVIRVKFRLDLFSHFREKDFWRFKKKIQYGCRIMWPMASNFFLWTICSRDDPQIFIPIRCSVLHMQLWCHTEGTKDVMKKKITLIPHEEYLPCAKFQFFSFVRFQRYRGPKFFSFSNMAATPCDLWRHNYQ